MARTLFFVLIFTQLSPRLSAHLFEHRAAHLPVVRVAAVAAADAALPVPNEASFLPGMLKLYNPPNYEPWYALPYPDDSTKIQSGKHWYMAGKIAAPDKMAG